MLACYRAPFPTIVTTPVHSGFPFAAIVVIHGWSGRERSSRWRRVGAAAAVGSGGGAILGSEDISVVGHRELPGAPGLRSARDRAEY